MITLVIGHRLVFLNIFDIYVLSILIQTHNLYQVVFVLVSCGTSRIYQLLQEANLHCLYLFI